MSLPVVAIVGRPNVGKSTLFNRLVGFQKAIVHDRPGVTRDRLYEEAEALGRRFLLIDTGGLEIRAETPLLDAMKIQSLVAVEEADAIVFVTDGRQGYTTADEEVTDVLRRSHKPVIFAVNKVDGPRHEDLINDFWGAGLTPIIPISAAHGRGIYELAEAILEALPPAAEEEEEADRDGLIPDDGTVPVEENGEIRIAVIGRPNVGKSTLVNRLIGEDRHVVHDAPGTTMDTVDSAVMVGDRRFLIVDTAGVRRRARIEDALERTVTLKAIRAIERCHVALLMIDGTLGPSDQDAKLAKLVVDRGRALIILFNKWDVVPDLEDINSYTTEDAKERRFPHATWAPHLFISAKTGKGVGRIFPLVERAFVNFNRHISTGQVNRFLEQAIDRHSPPQRYHHPVRLYYATQTRVRPPTFIFFSNSPDGIKDAYQRYLQRSLREAWDFEGSPLKLHFRERRKLGEESES